MLLLWCAGVGVGVCREKRRSQSKRRYPLQLEPQLQPEPHPHLPSQQDIFSYDMMWFIKWVCNLWTLFFLHLDEMGRGQGGLFIAPSLAKLGWIGTIYDILLGPGGIYVTVYQISLSIEKCALQNNAMSATIMHSLSIFTENNSILHCSTSFVAYWYQCVLKHKILVRFRIVWSHLWILHFCYHFIVV